MKRVVWSLVALVVGIAVIAAVAVAYLRVAYPKVGPAPDLRVSVTPEAIARGRYLAEHVMGCMGCHSERMYDRYAHPSVPGRVGGGGERWRHENDFPGILYSKNITPYALGNWSDGEIFRAIVSGVDRAGEPIFPIMPFDMHGQADPEDIKAVIAYLRTLPTVAAEWPASEIDFPVNLIVRTMPAELPPGRRPGGSDEAALGRYMVTLAACVHCHTDFQDGAFTGPEFAGGRVFPYPDLGLFRSANITPDKETGIGTWTREDFVARFKRTNLKQARQAEIARGERNTVMPWWSYAGMSERDLGAIYEYLMTLTPVRRPVTPFEPLPHRTD